jgi:AcrR family transcriptional regulator
MSRGSRGGGGLTFEAPQHFRKRPRQARSRRTVDALLDATETVLRAEGYPTASTNRIARAAGLSVGSLYQYFGDKDGLIGAAIERALVQEAESLAGVAEGARALPLHEGVARVVDAALRGRLRQRYLLTILAEHGLRFGPGTALDLVGRHQRGETDPLHRLVAGRRAELRDASAERSRASSAALLNATALAWAVEAPADVGSEALAELLADAITRHLAAEPPARASSPPSPALDTARLEALLTGACASSEARAALLDELIYQEQSAFDSMAAAGAAPEAICEGVLRFWATAAATLAGAAGAATLSGPCLEADAWGLRAERRARRLRAWLEALQGDEKSDRLAAAVFVVGRGLFELGLQLSLARDRDESIADAAALLAFCARPAAPSAALTSSSPAQ